MREQQLKKGIYLSYFLILINNLSNIVLTPLLINSFGQSEYGVYMLVGAFVGYISILDFGLSNTTIKFVSQYRILNEKQKEQKFIFSTLVIYLLLSLLVACIGILTYTRLDILFSKSLSENEVSLIKTMYLILILNLVFTLPMNLFSGIISAYEKFIFPRLITVGKTFLRIILIVFLVFMDFGIVYIVVLDTILNMVYMFILMAYVFIKLKIRIVVQKIEKSLIKEILSYSSLIFVSVVVDQLYWKIGHLLLGSMSSSEDVAVYAISMMIVQLFITCSTVFSGVLLPKVTKMVTKETHPYELTNLMIKVGRVQLIILTFILIGYTFFGKRILLIWLGEGFENSWLSSLLIMYALLIVLSQSIGILILQAKNLHGFRAFTYLVIALLNTILSYFLIPKYGVFGVTTGTILSLFMGNLIIMNIYYQKKIGLGIVRFLKELSNGILFSITLIIIINTLLSFVIQSYDINIFILRIVIYICTFSLLMYKLGINKEEKDLISREFMLKKFTKNI